MTVARHILRTLWMLILAVTWEMIPARVQRAFPMRLRLATLDALIDGTESIHVLGGRPGSSGARKIAALRAQAAMIRRMIERGSPTPP